jgi:anaerobic selenocysteine-containing dehydrogenase
MGVWERPPQQFLDALQNEFGFDPPRHHGYDTVDSIRTLRDHKPKVFIGLGGNFVQAAPDTDVTSAALQNATLTVHVSTKINRSHLICGDTALILPALGRTEIDEQASGPQYRRGLHLLRPCIARATDTGKSGPALRGVHC